MEEAYACRWGATTVKRAGAMLTSMRFCTQLLRLGTLAFAVASVMLAPAGAAEDDPIASFYEGLQLEAPTTDTVVVCHGFGCRYHTEIDLSNADRLRLSTMLAPGRASPTFERRAVATAIAWWDRRIGPLAGTSNRVDNAGVDEIDDPGQMDSVDTSTNNTSLFLVLDALKLLRYHQIEPPASRGDPLDTGAPQTAAVLGEIDGDRKWAFDNWTQKFGEMPDVEPLDQWQGEGN
jgi:hypothetical protein